MTWLQAVLFFVGLGIASFGVGTIIHASRLGQEGPESASFGAILVAIGGLMLRASL
jgi:uncharacterized membrane protein YczE